MGRGSSSYLERLVGVCVGLLVAALALYWAVQLLQAVWLSVLGIGVLLGCITWIRRRGQGW